MRSIEQRTALQGFSHINRYLDRTRDKIAAKILPGQYYVTIHDEIITTVLGSCVSACIRDKTSRIGGMNHFMLPIGARDTVTPISDAARYGNYAMEHMINVMLENGAKRENLEVKILGGGNIIANMTNVGQRNIDFVREYIHSENLNLVGEDVGDIYPRKVVYHPYSGKVTVKKLRSVHNNTIFVREEQYMQEIKQSVASGIALF